MIAYLRGEEGGEVVEKYLASGEQCAAHAINLCEVYYDFMRAEDEDAAKAAVEDLKSDGLVVREDFDESFWQEVGRYKATNRVSLADCVAITLANRNNARVVTSDHHEFEAVKARELCEVEFIR